MRSKAVVSSSVFAVILGLSASAAAQDPAQAPAASGRGVRIALQGRLDALNVLGADGGSVGGGGGAPTATIPTSFVPIVTAGVRLLDTRLFLGLGFGFFNVSVSQCEDSPMACDERETTTSTGGWSLSPLVSFDLLQDPRRIAALYILGWLNLANAGGFTVTDVRPGMTTETTIDGQFYWGANVGIGLRGNITEGIAIGSEWGWGFATTSDDGDTAGDPDDRTTFLHGVFGTVVFEASVGL